MREAECKNGVWLQGEALSEEDRERLRNGDTIHLCNEHMPVLKELKCVFHYGGAEPSSSEPSPEDPAMLRTATALAACSSDYECALCSMALLSAVALLPCNHSFCTRCVSDWLAVGTQGERCPKCWVQFVEVVVEDAVRTESARRIRGHHVCCASCGPLLTPADGAAFTHTFECVAGFKVPGVVAAMDGVIARLAGDCND